MATALIHMDPIQKQRLARRAKLRGKSFSQEVRDAVDMYLDVPVENEAELRGLAKAANHAADRIIKNLDETIGYVDRVLKHRRNGGELGAGCGCGHPENRADRRADGSADRTNEASGRWLYRPRPPAGAVGGQVRSDGENGGAGADGSAGKIAIP